MTRPNILYIMADDHAAHALSCYGSVINQTPQLDRIARDGALFRNAFCTNALCAPSRATILTGTYNHVNGVRALDDNLDNRQVTFPRIFSAAGYQTALIGKWHLGHGPQYDPAGFDYWNVLPEQGIYNDPPMIRMGAEMQRTGYVTDLITDDAVDWLEHADPDRPFLLMVQHKAPHSPWIPRAGSPQTDVAVPRTFDDDWAGRAEAARIAKIRIDRDLSAKELKLERPAGLSTQEDRHWKYQRFINDYLACVMAIDEGVGRLLDWLDAKGMADDTIVVYTSDQGFFLGDHGWFDKRFMYEQSLRMPLLVRYPREVPAGVTPDEIVLNVDFAQTLLDLAGLGAPESMQGRSFRRIAMGEAENDWREAFYYRYWEHMSAISVCAHYGLRTERYKLIYYYAEALGTTGAREIAVPKEWELFDLLTDAEELHNVYHQSEYATVRDSLTARLVAMQAEVGDVPV
jgi:arylsulfatase A-like enzyme